MNTTNYKQYDTRWAKLPYRYNPDNIGNNGCGEVSVCNSIIEMVSQMNQTPATMVDYCRQFACSDGTYHSGIPKMLEHYGCTEVMEHPHFASLWRELEKGNRIAIYLMDSTPAGSKGVHWTSGGHFVASVAYKCENGQHWVYMKDSNSISELRNGWITYEGNIRGACPKVWSGKLNGAPAPTPTPPQPEGKIAVDGDGGYHTVKRLQEFLGLSDPDGLIGRQRTSLKKYFPAFTSVSFSTSGGSNTIVALQKWLGLSDPDGLIGANTAGALQRRLRDYGYLPSNESIDNIIGTKTMKALQTALNNDFKRLTPSDPLQKWYDAMTDQYNWSKNQDYEWVTPTIESSKTKGTCITFPACSLQRLGMLPSGGYFYYYPDGQYLYCKPNGWLSDHSDWFSVSYPNKTIPELWRLGQIQKGDFVGFDNPAYHSMVFMGMNSSGQPIFNTMGHTKGLGITYSTYANRKVAVIVRLKKVK